MEQKTITNYYKTIGGKPLNLSSKRIMSEIVRDKKFKLSLRKPDTPIQTPVVTTEDKSSQNVIDLTSDDELSPLKPNFSCLNTSQSSDNSEILSDSSVRTELYDFQSPSTSKKPRTPNSKSPRSTNKFFSPTKKRRIPQNAAVKKNLNREFVKSNLSLQSKDESFDKACNGMDYKTICLLTIINDCLKDRSLKHLLDDKSQVFLSKCMTLRKPGMKVVCRLYWRKDTWYRREDLFKLVKEKDNVMDDVAKNLLISSLEENEFIIKAPLQGDNAVSFEDLTELLNKNELKDICKELMCKVQSKAEAIVQLRKISKRKSIISNFVSGGMSDSCKRVLKILYDKASPCYKLSPLARSVLYKLYVLMYLGIDYSIIREKQLELLLLNDASKKETYPVDKESTLDNASIVFDTNDDFERYMSAHIIYEDYLTKTDLKDKCDIVKKAYNLYKAINGEQMACYRALPPWLRQFTPAHLYVKILESGIQELKRNKTVQLYELAVDILSTLVQQTAFRQHKKAYWYAEKAFILNKFLNLPDKAALVLIEGLKSNLPEESKDCMRSRALKIVRAKNSVVSGCLKEELERVCQCTVLESNISADHFYKQPMEKCNRRGKILFETRNESGEMIVQEVEEYCISEYIRRKQFTNGQHWESRIIISIFFLLFWDIIYKPPRGVRGIFLTRFQRYPLDIFTESFYTNRKALIDDRLNEIETSEIGDVLQRMYETWTNRPENELSGICRSISWAETSSVAQCVGPRALAALCRRLAVRYRHASAGFPDVTLWDRHTRKIDVRAEQ